MNQYIDPPKALGDEISRIVEEFALTHSLRFAPWYHDQPVWRVWHEDEEGVVHEMRIVTAQTEKGNFVFFLPQAYFFADNNLYTNTAEATVEHTTQVPIPWVFLSQSEVQMYVKQLSSFMAEVWSRAESFGKPSLKPA